jgi:DNA-binding CsgD family transcriptional regulator
MGAMGAFHQGCEEAGTLGDLAHLLSTEAAARGLIHVALVIGRGRGIEPALRLHNYPGSWIQRVKERRYHRLDPVLAYASMAASGFSWDAQDFLNSLSERQARMMSEARAFRIAHGYTIPIASLCAQPASFSIIAETGDIPPELRLWAELAGLVAFRRALHIVRSNRLAATDPRLTPRECACLSLMSRGASDSDIGRRLAISRATASRHLARACLKLGARTRAEAVARAMVLGVIE